jgi:hypothetical protein
MAILALSLFLVGHFDEKNFNGAANARLSLQCGSRPSFHTMRSKPQQGFEHQAYRRSGMKKFLTIMAVLTSVATPALAQSANQSTAVNHRAQTERSVPTQGQSTYSPFGPGDTYGGGAD